jgi:hypothetical protein
MSYKITIEETRTVMKPTSEWKVIDTKPDETAIGGKKEIYGYTPTVEKQVTETVKVYEQTVEALGIAAVIAVVNKLEPLCTVKYTHIEGGEVSA